LGLNLSEGLGSAAPAELCRWPTGWRGLAFFAAVGLGTLALLPTQLGTAMGQGGDQSSCFLATRPSTSRHVSFSLQTLERDPNFVPDSTVLSELQRRSWCSAARGCAALEVFSSRRQALTLLRYCTASIALPNVRAKLGPTV
jgi:hypothetical protein